MPTVHLSDVATAIAKAQTDEDRPQRRRSNRTREPRANLKDMQKTRQPKSQFDIRPEMIRHASGFNVLAAKEALRRHPRSYALAQDLKEARRWAAIANDWVVREKAQRDKARPELAGSPLSH